MNAKGPVPMLWHFDTVFRRSRVGLNEREVEAFKMLCIFRPNAIRNLIYQMVDPFASSLETLMERERRDEMDDVVVVSLR